MGSSRVCVHPPFPTWRVSVVRGQDPINQTSLSRAGGASMDGRMENLEDARNGA
jgi:hypothetical protein